jgi:predicted nucleic acid-binding protein
MPYLLDADWVINALSGRSEAAAILDRLAPDHLAVSVLTVGEVFEVAFNSPNPAAHLENFRRFLAPFQILLVTEPIVERFAEIRAHLRRRGELISDFDILLAAVALHHDLVVLTFNVRHLRRVPDLQLYSPR